MKRRAFLKGAAALLTAMAGVGPKLLEDRRRARWIRHDRADILRGAAELRRGTITLEDAGGNTFTATGDVSLTLPRKAEHGALLRIAGHPVQASEVHVYEFDVDGWTTDHGRRRVGEVGGVSYVTMPSPEVP